MAATFPSLLTGGIDVLGRFDPFDLFAGDGDPTTNRAQAADNTAIAQFEVLTFDDEGRLIPWTAAGDYPTGTLTFSSQPTDEDTLTINGQAMAFETVGSGVANDHEVTIGATTAITAQSTADEINAFPLLYEVYASILAASPTVVNLTALEEGTGDNALTLAISATYPVLSAATLTDVAGTETVPFANAIGIAAQPVPASTPGAFVPYYDGGGFNHLALVWPGGVSTLEQRRMAFAGTPISVHRVL